MAVVLAAVPVPPDLNSRLAGDLAHRSDPATVHAQIVERLLSLPERSWAALGESRPSTQ